MKTKDIKFTNGSIIQALPSSGNVIRSDIKYLFPRANSKPAMTMIRFFELCLDVPLTDKEKMEIWNMFYGGHDG